MPITPSNRVAQRAILQLTASLMCWALVQLADAAEVYKWTDADGQTHFGDRLSAPSNGKKVDVKVQATHEPVVNQHERANAEAGEAPWRPRGALAPRPQDRDTKSTPADPAKVRPGCQDLIDQISKVKPGVNWESLSQKFNATCPGIAYECVSYKRHPENDKCTWIERTGGNVMRTKIYE